MNDGGVVRDYDPAIDSYNFATASYMVTPQDVYSFFSSREL